MRDRRQGAADDGRRTTDKTDLFAGRVLFHCHTHHTDGRPSVADYLRHAAEHGLDRVVFLEHIRRNPSYDVAAFVEEIRGESERHGVPAVVGFEAKALPGGGLDITSEHAALAEVIGIAEHGFPDDPALWRTSLDRAFATWGAARQTAVWVHPGLWLKKTRRLESHRADYEALIALAQAAGVLIERNHRYRLLPDDALALVRPERLVHGADAHRLDDVDDFFEDEAG